VRPLIFGEVLFDRFPDGTSVLGGAPFNVAWHLRGFGLDPLLISRIGEDARGREIARAMGQWALDARGIQIDANRPTGVVEVTLGPEQHTFSILPDQAYDFIDSHGARDASSDSDIGVVYHGTLALRNPASRTALEAVRDAARDAPVFLDVNLRDPWWQSVDLPGLCARARWLKLNEDELDRISRSLGMRPRRLEDRAVRLLGRFDLELLVVTYGARGATAWAANGEVETVEPEMSIDVVDTVGAGDAFTAVLLFGLIRNWKLPTTLRLAQTFANAICGVRGATVRVREFYARITRPWSTV
jgi:fructokinase